MEAKVRNAIELKRPAQPVSDVFENTETGM